MADENNNVIPIATGTQWPIAPAIVACEAFGQFSRTSNETYPINHFWPLFG
jgi:hypothetical protein